jgi:hypothetical protein
MNFIAMNSRGIFSCQARLFMAACFKEVCAMRIAVISVLFVCFLGGCASLDTNAPNAPNARHDCIITELSSNCPV